MISASLLPTPANTMFLGPEPGTTRGQQLEARHDVDPRAEVSQDTEQAEARVGLHGVVDPMPHLGKGPGIGAVRFLDGGAAVEVEGCAKPRGHIGESHAVALEVPVDPAEPVAHRSPAAGSFPSILCVSGSLWLFLSNAATSPESPSTPTRFGKICRPFMRSPQAQTVSTLLVAPKKTRPQ